MMEVPGGKRDRAPSVEQMGPSAADLETVALGWKLLRLLTNNMIDNTARQQVLSWLEKSYFVQMRHTLEVLLKRWLKRLLGRVDVMSRFDH